MFNFNKNDIEYLVTNYSKNDVINWLRINFDIFEFDFSDGLSDILGTDLTNKFMSGKWNIIYNLMMSIVQPISDRRYYYEREGWM